MELSSLLEVPLLLIFRDSDSLFRQAAFPRFESPGPEVKDVSAEYSYPSLDPFDVAQSKVLFLHVAHDDHDVLPGM